MYFLVDYENVKNPGMQGTQYLQPSDHVFVFYSSSVPYMESQHLEEIKASGCRFQVYKLLNPNKNALDFYIVTKLGEIFGTGYKKAVAIITKDTGFKAAQDFWTSCASPSRRVILSESIERSIISSNEQSPRMKLIQSRLKAIDIGNFFSAYTESLKLRRILEEAFADTSFISRLDEMENILKTGKTPKVIYLDTLHRFGRKDGLEIYRRLKNCADF